MYVYIDIANVDAFILSIISQTFSMTPSRQGWNHFAPFTHFSGSGSKGGFTSVTRVQAGNSTLQEVEVERIYHDIPSGYD